MSRKFGYTKRRKNKVSRRKNTNRRKIGYTKRRKNKISRRRNSKIKIKFLSVEIELEIIRRKVRE